MKEQSENVARGGSILAPFLIGGLFGAGLALLLAPKSGRELRKDLEDYTADARENIAATVDKGRDLLEGSKTAVKSAVEAGKSAYFEERDKARQAA